MRESAAQVGTKPNHTEWFTPARFVLVLLLAFVGQFPEVWAGSKTFLLRDFGLYSYPVAHHWRESFWRGEVPLWNPLNSFGTPFLAQWSTLVLYPPTLFYLLLPLAWALPVFTILHLVFGGLGMFILARRWTGNSFAGAVAGFLFAFNGLTLSSLPWPHYAVAIAWMPWIVLTSEQALLRGGRWTLWAAIAGTMQMLSGMPEMILMTWMLVAAVWVVRMLKGELPKRVLSIRFAAQITLITGLAAGQLAPFLQLLGESTRGVHYGNNEWAMPATGLANFLVPLYGCFDSTEGVIAQGGQHLVPSYFPGVACVWFALIGMAGLRRIRVLCTCLVTVLAVLLAMGESGFVFTWVKEVLPVMGLARYPVKFLYLAMLAAPLLAAFGVARMDSKTPLNMRIPMIMAAVLILIILGIGWSATSFGMNGTGRVETNALVRVVFLVLTVALTHGLSRLASRHLCLIQVAMLVAMFLDIRTHAPPLMTTIEGGAYQGGLVRESLNLKPAPLHGESRLMIAPPVDVDLHYMAIEDKQAGYLVCRSLFFSNANLLDDISKVNGFFSLRLQAPEDVIKRFYERGEEAASLKDFLCVSQYSSRTNGLEFAARNGFLPMVTAGQQPRFESSKSTLDGMFSPSFNPKAEVFLNSETKSDVQIGAAGSALVISSKVSRHTVEAEVESASPAVVVISQSAYPAWRCSVNGIPAPLHRANHAFQCAVVPSGKNHIVVRYVDAWFIAGGASSLLCLAGCWVWFVRSRQQASIAA